ncbi:MAG: metallophosphoesterase [Propionibacteriaceae bacterium]|jgi:predicted MPP superfamily phosphohydrolase|nr:metallophosphoesterase [Propionibacteriaceae bacterium]
MSRQIPIALIVVGAMLAFIIWRVAFATKLGRRGQTLATLGSLLVIAFGLSSLPLGWAITAENISFLRPLVTAAYLTLAVVGYVFLGLVVVMLASMVWRMVADTDSDDGFAPRVRFIRIATAAAVAIAVALIGWGYARARTPEITHIDYSNEQVPRGFDGFTIALVTDLHVGPVRDGAWLRDVVEQINAAHPDLIIVAGDLVDGTPAAIGDDMLPLTELYAPYGVYLTTGNHEFYSGVAEWMEFWNEHDIKVLDNEAVVIKRGGASFDLVGINDRTGDEPYQPDLQQAVDSLSEWDVKPTDTKRFRVLAAHQPLQALLYDGLAARLGIDLQLSGHTHGGQMWPVHALVIMQQPVIDGVHELNGVTVVTSRGAGAWGPPVRVLADPEIVLVTLRRGA